MKILIIGCGSIGERHIKNLLSLKAGQLFVFDIDKERINEIKNISPHIEASYNIGELWKKKPEIVFITVPTALHVKYALEAARKGCHLFIEKPLSNDISSINSLIKIVGENELISMVGCNMRFYWAIKKIEGLIKNCIIGKIISARIEIGQYLPSWGPFKDYRKTYSAQKKMGGGIILDAIHEIDYAVWLWGEVENILCMYGKLSDLEIETEDIAEIILKFKNGPIVSIHMDYIERGYSRKCKILGERGTISWDFNDHYIKLCLEGKKCKTIYEPKGYETNSMYVDEIKYFLHFVKKKQKSFNDIKTACKILNIALTAKKKGVYVC